MMRSLSGRHGMALMRIGFGAYFLASAYDKTNRGWLSDGRPLAKMLQQSLTRAQPFYGDYLRTTVIPHVALFAQLTTLAEWAVGLCLLLGLFTPVGALVAIWLNTNYMLMKGFPGIAGSIDRLFILSELMIILTAAGWTWGLDGFLWRRVAKVGQAHWLPGQAHPSSH